MKRALLVAAGVLACATAATVLGTAGSGDEIRFPHQKHVEAKLECIGCHESIWDAKTLAGSFLPQEAKCLECHKQKKEQGECAFCHAEVRHAGPWATREPRLKLDHAAHLERVKEDCTQCHSRLSEPGRPAPVSDGHQACLKCHEHARQYDDARCDACHVSLAAYPLTPLSEVSHQGDFLRRHPAIARSATQSCASCHDQNFCLDCHARTAMAPVEVTLVDRPDRRFIHRNDFLGRHAVEARADSASCQRCHSTASCDGCHRVERVAAGSPGALDPHPKGWAVRGFGAAFHGDAARRDIQSCAACHDEGAETNCVECHKLGGIGGNPHPASFRARHSLAEAAAEGRCAPCHR